MDLPVLDPAKRNLALETAVAANMEALGIVPDADDGRKGSSDMGNLSHYLPAIHPYLAIADPEVPGHSAAFRDATTSDRGRETLLKAAKMLAMTAYDLEGNESSADCTRSTSLIGEDYSKAED